MEKRKAQMRVEERDRRFEELQNQMLNAPEEIEISESTEEELPFEITGLDSEEEPVNEEPLPVDIPKKEEVEEDIEDEKRRET